MFDVNFDESVINKQLMKIKKGIPKAIIQFGLFVVDIVIMILFVLTTANVFGLTELRFETFPNEILLTKITP
jgi:hypothetical protein